MRWRAPRQRASGVMVHVMAAVFVWLLGAAGAGVAAAAAVSAPRYRFNIRHEEVFGDTRVIPDEHEVSPFLYEGQTRSFFYESRREGPLAITVTPCTSSVLWTIRQRSDNHTGGSQAPLHQFRGRDAHTFRLEAAPAGLYVLEVGTLERASYVHLYASRRPDAAHPLAFTRQPRLRLRKRQRRQSLAVRWEPSSVDPHLMHYCLVVNTRRYYSTLCEARGDRDGVSPPDASDRPGFNFPHERLEAHKLDVAHKAERPGARRHEDIVIACVGRRTQYTLRHLQHGKVYHLNVFAVNRRTNLSVSHGSTTLKYEQRQRPLALTDGERASVNLRQMDGRAIFTYKVPKNPVDALQMYVMACEGAVDVRLRVGERELEAKRRVDGYERLRIETPEPGQRYVLQVWAANDEERRRISVLEVLATTRGDAVFPLPRLPASVRVHEYESLRRCDAITVGWMTSPERQVSYCVRARETRSADMESSRRPNQCRLQRAVDAACLEAGPDNVTTHVIDGLRPGAAYVVQVTVAKADAGQLSYDLLQVRTRPLCA